MNAKDEKSNIEAYFREAQTWETDRLSSARRNEKIAWIVAGVSAFITILAVGAVIGLTPLKSVEGFLVRVNDTTGAVDIISTIRDGKTNYDEVVNKYFLQQYVRFREGYSRDLAETYYSSVGIMSSDLEQKKYYEWFNPKNPESPLAVYGANARVRITILGTTFIKPTIGLVRYTKTVERGAESEKSTHWSATITFKYSGAPMSEKDRGINPLGFQVTEYRNDPDAAVGPNSAAPATQGATPPAQSAQ